MVTDAARNTCGTRVFRSFASPGVLLVVAGSSPAAFACEVQTEARLARLGICPGAEAQSRVASGQEQALKRQVPGPSCQGVYYSPLAVKGCPLTTPTGGVLVYRLGFLRVVSCCVGVYGDLRLRGSLPHHQLIGIRSTRCNMYWLVAVGFLPFHSFPLSSLCEASARTFAKSPTSGGSGSPVVVTNPSPGKLLTSVSTWAHMMLP